MRRGRPKKQIDLVSLFQGLGIERITSLNSKTTNDDDVLFFSVTPPIKHELAEAFMQYAKDGRFGKDTTVYLIDKDIDITKLKKSEIANV
jgi:hypothetical protein